MDFRLKPSNMVEQPLTNIYSRLPFEKSYPGEPSSDILIHQPCTCYDPCFWPGNKKGSIKGAV